MDNTTYGYRNPTTGDLSKGTSGWMASYNFNVSRLDGHTHDGVDSPQLSISSYATLSSALLAAGWGASGALYKQTVTVPAGISEINNYVVQCYAASGTPVGRRLFLTIVRLTATTFDVYCNDNTIDVTLIYR